MPPEDLPRRYDDDQQDTVEEYPLDELAKALADGTIPRRRALKMLAGALLGSSLLALFLPGAAAWANVEQHIGGGGRRRHHHRRRGGLLVCPTGTALQSCSVPRTCASTTTCPPDVAAECAQNPDTNLRGCCPVLLEGGIGGIACIIQLACVPPGTPCPLVQQG